MVVGSRGGQIIWLMIQWPQWLSVIASWPMGNHESGAVPKVVPLHSIFDFSRFQKYGGRVSPTARLTKLFSHLLAARLTRQRAYVRHPHLTGEDIDLLLQLFVLRHLPLEKTAGERRLLR